MPTLHPLFPKEQLLSLLHAIYLAALASCNGFAGNSYPPNARNKETRHQQRPAL